MRVRPLFVLGLGLLSIVVALFFSQVWRVARNLVDRFEARLLPEGSARSALDARLAASLVGAPLPSLAAAPGWLHGRRVAADTFRGQPTVVVLWTVTSPAVLRTMPRVEAWHQAFARYGVHVIGIHVPEFAFAADSAVVASAARRLGLTFPIALDPSLELWRSFGPRAAWPRFVLADGTGRVILDVTGEDALDLAERALRRQLEAFRPDLRFPSEPGDGAAGETRRTRAGPESPAPVYLGTSRVARGPLAGVATSQRQMFTAQFRYQVEGELRVPYPVGLWTPAADGLVASRGGAENFVALRYDAGPLGAVLSPPPSGPARVWILRDERWLGVDDLGVDARRDGRGASFVLVTEPRLYMLCRERGGEHVVKLSPDAPGVTIHAFTFEPIAPPATAGR